MTDYGSLSSGGALLASGIVATGDMGNQLWIPCLVIVIMGLAILAIRLGFRRGKSPEEI